MVKHLHSKMEVKGSNFHTCNLGKHLRLPRWPTLGLEVQFVSMLGHLG
jgi:hypothetical protein